MKKEPGFPAHGEIESEAAEWLVLLDRDVPPTVEERRALQNWLNKNSSRRKSLSNLAELWEQMNVLTKLSVEPNYSNASEPPYGTKRLWQ